MLCKNDLAMQKTEKENGSQKGAFRKQHIKLC
jgi:hypothetical protein